MTDNWTRGKLESEPVKQPEWKGKIKPCPFCKTTDLTKLTVIVYANPKDKEKNQYGCGCWNCRATGSICNTVEQAIHIWNRVSDDVKEQEFERKLEENEKELRGRADNFCKALGDGTVFALDSGDDK